MNVMSRYQQYSNRPKMSSHNFSGKIAYANREDRS